MQASCGSMHLQSQHLKAEAGDFCECHPSQDCIDRPSLRKQTTTKTIANKCIFHVRVSKKQNKTNNYQVSCGLIVARLSVYKGTKTTGH